MTNALISAFREADSDQDPNNPNLTSPPGWNSGAGDAALWNFLQHHKGDKKAASAALKAQAAKDAKRAEEATRPAPKAAYERTAKFWLKQAQEVLGDVPNPYKKEAVVDQDKHESLTIVEAFREAAAGETQPVPSKFTAALQDLASDRAMMEGYYSKFGATTWGHAYEAVAERVKDDLKLAQQFVQFAPKNGIDPAKYAAAMPRDRKGYLANLKGLLDWAMEFVDFDYEDWSKEDNPMIPSAKRPALRKPPL